LRVTERLGGRAPRGGGRGRGRGGATPAAAYAEGTSGNTNESSNIEDEESTLEAEDPSNNERYSLKKKTLREILSLKKESLRYTRRKQGKHYRQRSWAMIYFLLNFFIVCYNLSDLATWIVREICLVANVDLDVEVTRYYYSIGDAMI
jgi:hypothetical protein